MHHVVEWSPGEVEALLRRAVELFVADHSHQFAAWWDRFDRTARRLYAALERTPEGIAREGAPFLLQAGEYDRAVEVLCTTGVARVDVEGRCVAAGEMFRRWYLRAGALDLEPPQVREVERLAFPRAQRSRETRRSSTPSSRTFSRSCFANGPISRTCFP